MTVPPQTQTDRAESDRAESDRARVERSLAAVAAPDEEAAAAAAAELAQKLKPPGSLGRLEELAIRVAGIRGTAAPGRPRPAVVVCAADHGVCEEQVSAYPAEVTGLMLGGFASGGAAVCVLARQIGARLVVADLGVSTPPAPPDGPTSGGVTVLDRRVRAGTGNSARGPAMSTEEAWRAVRHGVDLADALIDDGVDLVALGEMGIGNTTTAAALSAALLDVDPAAVAGPGTGLDAAQVEHKRAVLARILARHDPAAVPREDPVAVLAAMGGLEVAALAGVVVGCAARRVPVVLDGFITTAAALVAARLAPGCTASMIAGHRSTEPGHRVQLAALGLDPVLDLDLRLGEGSGATLALGVVDAALAVLAEMATFASLGLGPETG